MKIKVTAENHKAMMAKLNSLAEKDIVEGVVKDTATKIFNRTKRETPVGNYTGGGQLRQSSTVDFNGNTANVGYVKDYAPHVEYGHRLVRAGKQIGYVPGQRYFKKIVDAEEPNFQRTIERKIKEALK